MNEPTFLNPDGQASAATTVLLIHHGLRRDVRRLGRALTSGAASARLTNLAEAWTGFRGTLHGHHEAEDGRLFPMFASNPALADAVRSLQAEHALIDPLLHRGDEAFTAGRVDAARTVIDELTALLDAHLQNEERTVIPAIRAVPPMWPPASTDAEAKLMAEALIWTSDGVAPDIVAVAEATAPKGVRDRLQLAQSEYAAKCARVWGAPPAAGASRTAIPL